MENETKDNIESENDEVVEVEESEVEETEEETEEPQEDWKAKLEKLEKENKTLKIQKAKLKEKKPEAQPASQSDLSQMDLYALVQGNVHQEDVSEVTDYAKMKGISVSEALKSSIVKSILDEKSEQRKVANASNTGTTRRSQKEVSADVLLENASKGKLPESDADIAKLVEARIEMKRNKKR